AAGPPVVRDRRLVGGPGARGGAGIQQVAGRLPGLVALREVAREQAVRLRELLAVQLLERRADDAVQVAPTFVEEAAVRRLADEPVAEAVLGGRSSPLLDHEIVSLELGERGSQPLRGNESLHERGAERAADD